MEISQELYSACSYFIPRLMFLETTVAPKVNWGDIVKALGGFPQDEYDISSHKFWDIWFNQWKRLGDEYLADFKKRFKSLYSINCIRRACASYHWAEFMYFSNVERKLEIRETIRDNFLLYLNNIGINYEYEKLKYANMEVPYFVFFPKQNKDNIKTMILCNGLDSMTEVEIFSIAEYFLKEEYAVVLFDAPGRGINIGKTSLDLEIEKIIVLILETIHENYNLHLVGIAGISFGGYLALKAAYSLPGIFRICINISGAPKVNEFDKLPRRLKEDFEFVFQKDAKSMLKVFESMYFEPSGDIFPRTLTIHGGKDDIFPVEAIVNLDKQIGNKHTLIFYKDEAHVCLNKINQYIYDILEWTKQNF